MEFIRDLKIEGELVLASGSPRRKQFLQDAGFTFVAIPATIDETAIAGELPEQLVARLASSKAKAVADLRKEKDIVIGADTVVAVNNEILGKPKNLEDNLEMLLKLNNTTHEVVSSFSIICKSLNISIVRTTSTQITMRDVPKRILEKYVNTRDGLDKAGGFGIQGIAIEFISEIKGSFSSVVGLDMSLLISELERLSLC